MKIPIKVTQDVDAKRIKVTAKVCDSGCYQLVDADGKDIGTEIDGYVPGFFPGGDSDYLELDIDIETGMILNWKKPTPDQVVKAFFPKDEE